MNTCCISNARREEVDSNLNIVASRNEPLERDHLTRAEQQRRHIADTGLFYQPDLAGNYLEVYSIDGKPVYKYGKIF